jgi:hypothetical protein
MRPFDSIILTEDLSETIPAGTEGAIVDQYAHAEGVYIVELFARDGATLGVEDVRADQMTVTLSDYSVGERIALLADIAAHKLLRGQVGIIQERVGVGLYAVDFANADGNTQLTLHAGQMMLLHWHSQPSQQSA